MKLTNEEYNVLNHITSATKTDCWFWLKTDKDGNDYVYDLEEGCPVSWQDGLSMLYEAVDFMEEEDWAELGVDAEEIAVFNNLLERLGV